MEYRLMREKAYERFSPKMGFDCRIELEHINRYLLARKYVNEFSVLDIASGSGYGSFLLAQQARSVVGVDISEEAIAYAKQNYQKDNLKYLQGNASKLDFPDNTFDVVVCLETIEHLSQETQKLFIQEIARVLTPNGFLILSTPNTIFFENQEKNPYHLHELTLEELLELLRPFFPHVLVGRQANFWGNLISFHDYEKISWHLPEQDLSFNWTFHPVYYFILASASVLPQPEGSAYLLEETKAPLFLLMKEFEKQSNAKEQLLAIRENELKLRANDILYFRAEIQRMEKEKQLLVSVKDQLIEIQKEQLKQKEKDIAYYQQACARLTQEIENLSSAGCMKTYVENTNSENEISTGKP